MKTHPYIKICGMKDAENIRQVNLLKPDYMGFILYPLSKRYVGQEFELPSSFPNSVKRVGVFVNEILEDLMSWVNQLELDFVQLHGDEPPEYCMELKQMGINPIKSFAISEDFDFAEIEDYLPWIDFILFDTKTPERGGSGKQFNWQILEAYPYEKPFFLSGGIGPDDAKSILEIKGLPLHAIDINSRFEDSPGNKNIDLLKPFIKEIKTRNP